MSRAGFIRPQLADSDAIEAGRRMPALGIELVGQASACRRERVALPSNPAGKCLPYRKFAIHGSCR